MEAGIRRADGAMKRREAKVLFVGGKNRVAIDFCRLDCKHSPIFKDFVSGVIRLASQNEAPENHLKSLRFSCYAYGFEISLNSFSDNHGLLIIA